MSRFPVSIDQIEFDIANEGLVNSALQAENKGYDFYVESICVNTYCSDGLPVVVTHSIGNVFGYTTMMASEMIMNSGSINVIPVKKLFRGGRYDFKFSQSTNPMNSGRTIIPNIYSVGYRIPMMSQFNEDNVIYSIGDSIDVLDSYVTRIAGHRNYTMLNALRASNYSCRLASLAVSGKSLGEMIVKLKEGYGVIRKVDVLLVQMGTNDISQNVTDAQWTERLTYMKSHRDANYPKAKLVIVKVAPSNNAYTTGGFNGPARNVRQGELNVLTDAFVNSNSGNNIFTIDCFTAFPQTPANWADGVHLTQAGHDVAGNLLAIGMKSILGLS